MEYIIEKGIPIPTITTDYPLSTMEVSDSFTCPNKEKNKLNSQINRMKKHNKTFKTRTIDEDTIRVWRIT